MDFRIEKDTMGEVKVPALCLRGSQQNRVSFFKQKTAYEMCSCDWSSDVCSSDLVWQNYINKCIPLVFPQGVWNNTAFPLPTDYQGVVKQLDATSLNAWKLNPGGTANTGNLEQIGLLFDNSALAIKNGVNVIQPMGAFLGLIPNAPLLSSGNYLLPPTGSVRKWYDDLCTDTWRYNLWYATLDNGGFEPVGTGNPTTKYGQITGNPNIYSSSNIMEVSSNCTSISQQQTARINWVLQNAPGRQAWKDPWAITK